MFQDDLLQQVQNLSRLKVEVLAFTQSMPLQQTYCSNEKASNEIAAIAKNLMTNKQLIIDYREFPWLDLLHQRLDELQLKPDVQASILLMQFLCRSTRDTYTASPALQQILQLFSLSWCQLLLNEPQSITQTQHPCYAIYEKIKHLMQVVDKYSGNLSRKLCHGIYKVVAAGAVNRCSTASFHSAQLRIEHLEETYQKLRKHHLQTEIKKWRTLVQQIHAEKVVGDLIRETIGDGHFPVILLEFIENYISLFLEDYYHHHGPRGQQWQQVLKDISHVIWAFRSDVDKAYRDHFPTTVPQALRRLLLCVEPLLQQHTALYEDFLAIENLLTDRFHGYPIKLETIFNAPLFETDMLFFRRIDEHWRDKYTLDQWYLLLIEDKEIRCHALNREMCEHYLLLVNHSGEVLKHYDTKSPTFSPIDIQVLPLNRSDRDDFLFSNLHSSLHAAYKNFIQQNQDAISKLNRENELKALEEQAKQKEEEENYRLQQELQAKQRQEQERQRKTLIEQNKQRELEQEQKRQSLMRQVKELKLGALVNLILESGAQAMLDLTLITSTTGKYIFNDKQGQHHLSRTAEELVEMLLGEQLFIINMGSDRTHHQTLADIIQQQRQSKSKH